jgi:hypothetical protein
MPDLTGPQALPAVAWTDLRDRPSVRLTEHAALIGDGRLCSQAIA